MKINWYYFIAEEGLEEIEGPYGTREEAETALQWDWNHMASIDKKHTTRAYVNGWHAYRDPYGNEERDYCDPDFNGMEIR